MPFRTTEGGFVSQRGERARIWAWLQVVSGVGVSLWAVSSSGGWDFLVLGAAFVLMGADQLTQRLTADEGGLSARSLFRVRSFTWDEIDALTVDYSRFRLEVESDGRCRRVGVPLPAARQDRRHTHDVLRRRVCEVKVEPSAADTIG